RNITYRPTREQRIKTFEANTIKRGPDDCWFWIGGKDKDGYGRMSWNGYVVRAPRLAYYLSTGKDPWPFQVLHTCDNPPCVNPAHLFTGTPKDNVDDAKTKGRRNHPVGEQCYAAKISDKTAREIISTYEFGKISMNQLSVKLGVPKRTISDIVRGRSWKHLS